MKNEGMEAKDALSMATNNGRHNGPLGRITLWRVRAVVSDQEHVQMIYYIPSKPYLLALRLPATYIVHAHLELEPRIRQSYKYPMPYVIEPTDGSEKCIRSE